jgi:hypothetical protein
MTVLYDDNFGYWRVDDAEELAFFKYVQSQSVERSCERCRGAVRLMSSKLLCAPCLSALECGAPLSMEEYGPWRRGRASSRVVKPRPSAVARLRRA